MEPDELDTARKSPEDRTPDRVAVMAAPPTFFSALSKYSMEGKR
jgi:hypothetical protein